MSEQPFLSSDTDQQFDIFKLSERGFTLEQINKIFELDEYFSLYSIEKQGELVKYILKDENILFNTSLVKNIEIVLKYQNNSIFNNLIERLRCVSIADYYKYILSVTDLERFYHIYAASPHDAKSLNYIRDENGYIVLEPKDYLITNIPSSKGSRAGRWYLLNNGTTVFIKNLCSMKEGYSELVAQEIAKQMGIPHAEYDLINMGGLIKTASINVLETGEELLHGSDILQVLSIKDIDSICNSICIKIKRDYPNVTAENIQNIKEEFLKLTIFDKIVGNWDRNPDNWGLIIGANNSKIKLAPEFDDNRSLNLHNFDCDKDMHLNGDHKIQTLLDYCFEKFSDKHSFLSFVENCVQNVNIRTACENIRNKKNIAIPQEEIREMEFIVHGRGTQVMRHWLREKIVEKKSINSDGEYIK